jgi:hypothetical protein
MRSVPLGGALCSGLGGLLIPVADGPRPLLVGMLTATQALLAFGVPINNANSVSLRPTMFLASGGLHAARLIVVRSSVRLPDLATVSTRGG